jgi:hypothetical protein
MDAIPVEIYFCDLMRQAVNLADMGSNPNYIIIANTALD